ncbi:MAG: hypothetical protein RR247_02445 [Clostridia bacterium]
MDQNKLEEFEKRLHFLKTSVDTANNSIKNISITNENCVKTTAQTFTPLEKQSARSNIGAGTSDFSGSYADLTNKPAPVTYASLTGTPKLATVATSGKYLDLLEKPALFSGSYADLTNKPAPVTYASLTDKPALAPVATAGTYASLTGAPKLATVATSGKYLDLLEKPALFSGSYADLTNKPAPVTYASLTDKPALAPVATAGTYASLTGAPKLATVATSGSYNDLLDKPAPTGGGGGLTFNQIYPVGSIYISVVATNPSALFGGTWQLFGPGRTIVCVDSNDYDFIDPELTGGDRFPQAHVHGSTVSTTIGAITGEFDINSPWSVESTSANFVSGGFSKSCSPVSGPVPTGVATTNVPLTRVKFDFTPTATPKVQVKKQFFGNYENLQPFISAYVFKRLT